MTGTVSLKRVVCNIDIFLLRKTYRKRFQDVSDFEKELHNNDKNDEALTDLTDYRNVNLVRPSLEMRNLKVMYPNLARDKQQSQTYTTVE